MLHKRDLREIQAGGVQQSEAWRIAKVTFWGAIAAALIGLLASVINVLPGFFSGDDADRPANAAPSAAAPPATTAQPSASPAGRPTSSEPSPGGEFTTPAQDRQDGSTEATATDAAAPDVNVQQGPAYLSALPPVGGLGNDKHTGAAELADGITYGNSVIFTPRQFGSSRLTVTYNTPRSAARFIANIGLDEETPDGFKVLFQASGPVNASFTLVPGQTRTIDQPTTGTGRPTVTVEVMQRPAGTVNAPCHAVWGDARFTTGT